MKLNSLTLLLISTTLLFGTSCVTLQKNAPAPAQPPKPSPPVTSIILPRPDDVSSLNVVSEWLSRNKELSAKLFEPGRVMYAITDKPQGLLGRIYGTRDSIRIPDLDNYLCANPVFSKDYRKLYFLFHDRNMNHLFSIDSQGNSRYLYSTDKQFQFYDLSPDGKDLLINTSDGNRLQIYRYNFPEKILYQFSTPTVGGVFPQFSSDGKYVSYISKRRIYIREISTGIEKIFADNGMQKELPKWAPDGHSIVYQASYGGTSSYDIYKLNLQTGESIQLTTNPALDAHPSFDRTGQFILYVTSTEDFKDQRRLAIMRADGSMKNTDSLSENNINYPEAAELFPATH